MAATRKRVARPAKTAGSSATEGPSTSIGIVVKRGALRRFDRLKQSIGELPVDVTWDRRTTNGPAGRRRTERRQPPSFTWEMAGFVVVERKPPVVEGDAARTPPSKPSRPDRLSPRR
jgi:hypothetical protein